MIERTDAATVAIDAVASLVRELDAYRTRYLKLEERMKEADAAASVPIYPMLTDLVTAARAGDEAGIDFHTAAFKRQLAGRRLPPPATVHSLLLDPRFMAGTARIRFHDHGHAPDSVEADLDPDGGYILLSINEATGIISELREEDDCDMSIGPDPWCGWHIALTYKAEIVGPRPIRIP